MFIDTIYRNSIFQRFILWHNNMPSDIWHSWDATPWNHPWLTAENLESMKSYSANFLNNVRRESEKKIKNDFNFAFCGNMANALYMRAVPLRKHELNISIFLHPHDASVMSHPIWEEFDGIIEDRELLNIEKFKETYPYLNISSIAHQHECSESFYKLKFQLKYSFTFRNLLYKYKPYFCFLPTIEKLREFSAALTSQCPYLPYLSGIPYIAAQNGGDIWYEASRNDLYGCLQREAFRKAKVFIVSNPWSFSHARRYGFRHFIYLPLIIDEKVYSPGYGYERAKWVSASNGNFFILTTSRLDDGEKGNSIILDAFSIFVKKYPKARLVYTSWGKDHDIFQKKLEQLNIKDSVICLPLSGKARIRDYLRSSDCFIDQFKLGYYGSAGLEALATGKPVIGRIEKKQYDSICNTGAPPILNSQTVDDIVHNLTRLVENQNYLFHISEQSRAWFLSNHSAVQLGESYAALLKVVAMRRRFSFSDNPLMNTLSKAEKEYHAENLNLAPIFPHYFNYS